MRRVALLTITMTAFAVAAAPAEAGAPIAKLPACENSYLYYASGVSRADYRAALLCLINGARKAEHLPALKRSAPLEAVGQSQSDKFAATGHGSHGKSLADITKRFAQRGYRAAAYNEAFAVGDPRVSPYAFMADMLSSAGPPCSEIFDPRFRDVGIGVSIGMHGVVDTLALEFGRRAGTSQPATSTRASTTCGHKIPKPLVTGAVVDGRGLPKASGSTVSVELACVAPVTCTFGVTLSLPAAYADAPAQELTIAAGQTQTVTFTVGAAALATELAAAQPRASLAITVTAPAQYTDTLTAPLSG